MTTPYTIRYIDPQAQCPLFPYYLPATAGETLVFASRRAAARYCLRYRLIVRRLAAAGGIEVEARCYRSVLPSLAAAKGPVPSGQRIKAALENYYNYEGDC